MNNSIRFQPRVEPVAREAHAFVYCPICTHTVEGLVTISAKSAKVKPGQKCSRCSAALDPAIIVRMDRAAA